MLLLGVLHVCVFVFPLCRCAFRLRALHSCARAVLSAFAFASFVRVASARFVRSAFALVEFLLLVRSFRSFVLHCCFFRARSLVDSSVLLKIIILALSVCMRNAKQG